MRQIPALLMISLALSCDKPAAPTTPPEPGPPAGEPTDSAADGGESPGELVWADLSLDDKKKHMAQVVVPTLGAAFKGFNAERYANVDCKTCHGPGAAEGKFAMPSPDLPKLPPNGDFAKLTEAKPEVVKFMMEQVVPQMATSLNVPPYDAASGQGFGCYGCHQTQ